LNAQHHQSVNIKRCWNMRLSPTRFGGLLHALLAVVLGTHIGVPGVCQTGNSVVGSGYTAPLPIAGAPGQLLTIYVQGIGAGLTGRVQAKSLPLPTSLAGISVSVQQNLAPQGPIPVPLLAVFPVNSCTDASGPCGALTGIDLQIPFELVAGPIGGGGISGIGQAKLVVSESGVAGAAVGLNPDPDQIHVVRFWDSLMGPPTKSPSGVPAPGTPAVAHADGSLVTPSKPARPGETVVIYSVGLGRSSERVVTGSAPASSFPVEKVAFSFDFRPNAAPSMPLQPGSPTVQAWMVAGNVGLYQINVAVPQPPPSTVPCGADDIQSNLTIDLGGRSSYDGAQICITIPPN
jgi:uncharacterized protein (TIGR03437 family)